MKKQRQTINGWLFLVLAGWLLSLPATAQDVIYFDDGGAVPNVRLKDINEEKISLVKESVTGDRDYSFSRSKILVAFSKTGNFLIVSELSSDLAQAKQQLRSFLQAPPRSDKVDFLIKSTPLTVIAAQISYESDVLVNYKTIEGNAATINKSELVAILYKDGRHAFLAPVGTAVSKLAEIRPVLDNGGQPLTRSVATQSKPAATETTSTPTSDQAQVAQTNESAATKPQPEATDKRTLTEEEKETYRQKSLQKVDEFVSYINIITDKNISSNDKDRAIKQAEELFMPQTTIEVTSTKRPGSRVMSLRQYLVQLKLLPYKYTKVEWIETQFVRDLMKEADGNYYGTIAGQQTFTGYGSGGQAMYSDVTEKNVRVKLQAYQKIIDGDPTLKWKILLGNVRVNSD